MGLGKIDLHCHLDGSMDLECSYELAKERNLIDDSVSFEKFITLMTVPSENPSLEEYLKCFDLPIAILQDEDAIYKTTLTLIRNLEAQGLIYVELRFAPQHHTKKGMSQEEVVLATLKARQDALNLYPRIKVNFILCMMTIGPEEINHNENLETVLLTKKYLGKGVVALDIAGAEGISPLIGYKPLFDKAIELIVPYTIHAGESGPASNVETAILLGAKRIGHGGHCSLDPLVKQLVIDNEIPLEICPTSNLHCRNQPSYENHAIVELYRAGAKVTINTDNMTLSHVTLDDEIKHAIKDMHFQIDDILMITKNAIDAAFISDQEKQELIQLLTK